MSDTVVLNERYSAPKCQIKWSKMWDKVVLNVRYNGSKCEIQWFEKRDAVEKRIKRVLDIRCSTFFETNIKTEIKTENSQCVLKNWL